MIHTYMEISQGKPLCNYLYLKLKCVLFIFSLFSPTKSENRREKRWHQREAGAPAGGKRIGK
jgi:hypothetical protein